MENNKFTKEEKILLYKYINDILNIIQDSDECYLDDVDIIRLIDKMKDSINWDYISRYGSLDYDFVKAFKDYINWNILCKCQRLPYEFYEGYDRLDEFKYYIDWDALAIYHEGLPETLIERFLDRFNLKLLVKFQDLSQQMLKEITNKMMEEE